MYYSCGYFGCCHVWSCRYVVTQHEIEKSGNWHYAFHAINSQTASFISARPEVKISGWHNTVSSEAGYFIKEQPIAISAQDKGVFEDIFLNGIAEGKYPDAPNEIAISSSLKDTASVLLNDTVELYNPNGSVADYQIVGFLATIFSIFLAVQA